MEIRVNDGKKTVVIEDQITQTEEERKNEIFLKGMLKRMNESKYI
jgi:hypothetical protein